MERKTDRKRGVKMSQERGEDESRERQKLTKRILSIVVITACKRG